MSGEAGPSVVVSGAKRTATTVELDDGELMEIMPIGAGCEVGRSCILVKFKGKQVMLDCGIHPAFSGLPALPFFDAIDPSEVDLCLVSHFHLDHSAAIPYLTEKTGFKGRVFMTHPSKAVYKLLLSDYVKVSHHQEDMLYDEQDLQNSLEKVERINYHEEVEHNGIKFQCYNAGHVLGAAMFMFDIAGVKVLYTGDFSKHDDRHLVGAEVPPYRPDVLIVESTYGIQVHEPRLEREGRFTRFVHRVVSRGGRCLIPVFALGRAQELLLILEEHWKKFPQLHSIDIWYASSLAKQCMTVFQTYINMMNKRIQRQFEVSNPFVFKHIKSLKSADHFQDTGPVVVMASPAMLQSGLSRQLCERWASDYKNGVIIPGYCVDGTLAKTIMSEPTTITTMDGQDIPLKMAVEYTSFSAHSDYAQTSEFIRDTRPNHVVLVHGDVNGMRRLKDRLAEENEGLNVHMPKNCETVDLRFQGEKMAKIIGQLATDKLKDGDVVSGVLINKDFDHTLISAEELSTFTELSTSTVTQKQLIPFRGTYGVLKTMVEQMFEKCTEVEPGVTLRVHDRVTLQVIRREALDSKTHKSNGDVLQVEWEADNVSDMVADSVLTLVLQIESNPTLLTQVPPERTPETENAENDAVIVSLLKHHFGDDSVDLDDEKPRVVQITVDKTIATIDLDTRAIESGDDALKDQLRRTLRRIEKALYPLD